MITKEAIMQKIESELQLAKQSTDHAIMLEHIEKIHLLTELVLESTENRTEQQAQGISRPQQITPTKVESTSTQLNNEHVALDDGTSIFDF